MIVLYFGVVDIFRSTFLYEKEEIHTYLCSFLYSEENLLSVKKIVKFLKNL